jgi:glutamine cyclotransferase
LGDTDTRVQALHSASVRRWLAAALCVLIAVSGLFAWSPWQRQAGSSAGDSAGFTLGRSFPHAADAYCQGLVWHDGFLFEGTGGYDGESKLRKVELETGRVLQEHQLAPQFFGEGITIWQDKLIQLTWKSQRAFVYDVQTFRYLGQFSYAGQGWGLTHDGKQLIMSDGTATLRFLDPDSFRVQRRLTVRDGRRRITDLNELEYVEGEIYANIWYEDRIARISPRTGDVLGWINLSRLYPASQRADRDHVLNGIAYDAQRRCLLVTGKRWPRLYEVFLPAENPTR